MVGGTTGLSSGFLPSLLDGLLEIPPPSAGALAAHPDGDLGLAVLAEERLVLEQLSTYIPTVIEVHRRSTGGRGRLQAGAGGEHQRTRCDRGDAVSVQGWRPGRLAGSRRL